MTKSVLNGNRIYQYLLANDFMQFSRINSLFFVSLFNAIFAVYAQQKQQTQEV